MRKVVMTWLTCVLLISFTHQANALDLRDRTTDLSDKPWSVTFNTPADPVTVNKDTVYIQSDDKGLLPSSLSISDDGKIIEVKPTKLYKPNVQYSLVILSKLRSKDQNIRLSKDTILKFKYEGAAYKSITAKPLPLGMNVIIQTKPEVKKIELTDAAGITHAMHRTGINQYSFVLLSQHIGDILNVRAYDANESILEDLAYELLDQQPIKETAN
ncbi:hypothetical protein CSV80_05840 [Sporosarcina sp. P12(2017)]|uniref:Ig-like domain-containing protein n=1 Tax=unclassified Sporosarcina TaxID=2647733 RepID=UPI000C166BFA|nr:MULTISPECIES: Ig-like domain-containing protein [unclassified Sporosarcina]PIC58294.1 hypothetical protein CSV81_03890 [Sporosarcina sp. P10]PIC61541.1 hypothetical protein CSV80_05840 [Sporosarcina sp. P12(2017)]